MTQAFYTAMSGINVSQTQLTVVANNIANINTTAFKSSQVNFEDIFYNTTKYGSAGLSDGTLGGTNPQQIGVGVKVESINKNFSQGQWNSTGYNTDLYLNGEGYFTLIDSGEGLKYTRDGSFSLDSSGYLVSANGLKVAGSGTQFGIVGSTEPIKIPTSLYVKTIPNETSTLASKDLKDLNGRSVNTAMFFADLSYTDKDGNPQKIKDIKIDNTNCTNMGQIASNLQTSLRNAINGIDGLSSGDIVAKCDDSTGGKLVLTMGNGMSLEFKTLTEAGERGSSAFIQSTGFGEVSNNGTNAVYSTEILDYRELIDDAATGGESANYKSLAINDDGTLEVTYSNGDTLTVTVDTMTGESHFKYTTADYIVIEGDDVLVDDTIMSTANFQLQLANFTNQQGLVACGNNTYKIGPNTGSVYFGTIASNAFGTVTSGGLEASNVDMAKEFSNMITAQRSIQANSRVFSTASDIMETISYLGNR